MTPNLSIMGQFTFLETLSCVKFLMLLKLVKKTEHPTLHSGCKIGCLSFTLLIISLSAEREGT